MKTPETRTPISPEEKTAIARSFYEDFKHTFKNFTEEEDPKRKRWAYRFLFLEEARDQGSFDMTSQVGFRHTDHIDDSISIISAALKLAKADPELEEGHYRESLIDQLRRHLSHIQQESQDRERKNLPPTAEPKSEEQEIKDATESVFLEIQANIEKHGTAGYATEKDIYNPTITTNRKTDYLPENLLKLSKILTGVSARIGKLTSQDPETREAHQKVINEIHQVLNANLIGIIERNQTPQKKPGLFKRIIS